MTYEDCALYIYAQDAKYTPPAELMNHLLTMNEAYDFVGSKELVFYNGLLKHSDTTFMDFEVEEKQLRELLAEYAHSNVSFLDWLGDELIRALAEDFDDIAQQEELTVTDVSFLMGDHEILNLENKQIVKTPFSFMFHCEDAPAEDMSRLGKALRSDKAFMEKLQAFQDIFTANCNFVLGPA